MLELPVGFIQRTHCLFTNCMDDTTLFGLKAGQRQAVYIMSCESVHSNLLPSQLVKGINTNV